MATKKVKTEVKESKPKKGLAYKLEVKVNDMVYKGEADSLEQALADFVSSPNYPFAVKTAVVMKFTDGKAEKQVVWPAMFARRKFKLLSLRPNVVEFFGGKFTNDLING